MTLTVCTAIAVGDVIRRNPIRSDPGFQQLLAGEELIGPKQSE